MPIKARKVVLGVCASIAAYKAGDLIRRLREKGCDVQVLLTEGAKEFITPLTLATLSAAPVIISLLKDDAW